VLCKASALSLAIAASCLQAEAFLSCCPLREQKPLLEFQRAKLAFEEKLQVSRRWRRRATAAAIC